MAKRKPVPNVTRSANRTFDVGRRVQVKSGQEHMPENVGRVGTVRLVEPVAYAVQFDGDDELHRWYVGSELEPAGGEDG